MNDTKVYSLTFDFSSVQFSLVAQSCLTLCDPMNRSLPGLPVHHQLLEFTQTHVHRVSDAIQPSHPLSSPSPPAPNLSHCRGLFQWVSSLHQVAKVWELQLQHQSFQWTPRTDFLWMDWLDLLAVQGTPKNLLQHHSSKAPILWHSAVFIVQLSHPYMTTGKTIALTRQTFVDKVMSLFFNMLSRLAITFLPRSKGLLISWLQSLSAVIFGAQKIKPATVSTVCPSICYEVMEPDLKEISPGCSLEGLMLKLKLQYFAHLMRRADSFEKTLMLGRIGGRRISGWQRMRWLDGITNLMDMGLRGLR